MGELDLALTGWRECKEAEARESWERVRWQAMVLLSPQLKKGHKLKTSDIAVFPWEKQVKEGPKKYTLATALEELKKHEYGETRRFNSTRRG